MKRRFEGKVVIVTGAGKGIGRACAIAFANEGASVAIADIDREAGETARSDGRGQRRRGDLPSPAILRRRPVSGRFSMKPGASFGGVDVLHNNAGVVRYGTVVDQSC